MTPTTESIRWRGGQVTRIEALSDAVFGFAIALLVVSMDVPTKFSDLTAMMAGFVPFAFTFALIILVWSYHYRLFSRYDLEDSYTIVLNSVLLFVVLFYIYPLKFVAGFLFKTFSGQSTAGVFSSHEDIPMMMTIYAAGFTAVFVVFALLYLHAYRLRDRMQLTQLQIVAAQHHIADCAIMAGAGLFSIALAQLLPASIGGPAAGFSYFLIGPAQFAVGSYFGRRLKALAQHGDGSARATA